MPASDVASTPGADAIADAAAARDAAPPRPVSSAAFARMLALGERLGYTEADKLTLFVVLATFTYLGLILTLAQGFLVPAVGRMSEGTMATGGAIAAMAGFVLLAVAANRNDFSLLLEAMALEVVGFAFVNPSLQSLLSQRAGPQPRERGAFGAGAKHRRRWRESWGRCSASACFATARFPYWAATGLMAPGLVMIVAAGGGGKDFGDAGEPQKLRRRRVRPRRTVFLQGIKCGASRTHPTLGFSLYITAVARSVRRRWP